MSERKEIESLIYLLDDPDEFVRNSVIERFDKLGEKSVPLIDEIRVSIKEPVKRQVVDDILLKLTFPSLEQEFLNYVEGGVDDLKSLEEGILMLSRIDQPTIRTELFSRKLHKLALEIEGEITYTLQPLRQAEILMHHVFARHDFGPAKEQYFLPEHALLHHVIDSKTGIPLTLSFVALFLARRLELPLSGVNMPIHFLMRYDFDNQVVYLDPFNAGKPVSVDECLSFLKRNNMRPEQSYFEAASPASMLMRAMRNLYNSYNKNGDSLRMGYMTILTSHLEILLGQIDEIDN